MGSEREASVEWTSRASGCQPIRSPGKEAISDIDGRHANHNNHPYVFNLSIEMFSMGAPFREILKDCSEDNNDIDIDIDLDKK